MSRVKNTVETGFVSIRAIVHKKDIAPAWAGYDTRSLFKRSLTD